MPDNPAERLYTVLLSLKKNPKETEKQAWERVSGATGTDLLLQRLAEASALVGEVEHVFLNHRDREHYMRWAPAVQAVFTDLAFRTSVGGRVAPALDEITLERLRNCAVRVSEMDLGPVLNESGITSLIAKLDTLIKGTTQDTELDNDVKGSSSSSAWRYRPRSRSTPSRGIEGSDWRPRPASADGSPVQKSPPRCRPALCRASAR
jgi:hypothetical protein